MLLLLNLKLHSDNKIVKWYRIEFKFCIYKILFVLNRIFNLNKRRMMRLIQNIWNRWNHHLLVFKVKFIIDDVETHNQNKKDWYYLNVEEKEKWKCLTFFRWFWWLNILHFILIKMKLNFIKCIFVFHSFWMNEEFS
jgi:hypothetical protein